MLKIKLVKDGYSTWSVFWVVLKRHKSSMRGELPRTVLELEPTVTQDLEEMKYKPKKHPGRLTPNFTQLPERFVDAAKKVLQGYPTDQIKVQAKDLSQYLFSRKPPMENDELIEKTRTIKEQIISNDPRFADTPTNAEDVELQEKKLKQVVLNKLKTMTYHWKPINYDTMKGMMYLRIRSAPEYAVLKSIFREIALRNNDFKPEAILDFGSGIGTVFWASYEQWGEEVKEYFAVDTSGDMNNIAQLLVQDGDQGKRPIIKGTFFRQFLPASHILTYDLVISAYSLMELPSRELRLQTLENLWTKTNKFMVIVEQGTNAGYKLVLEARDFILQASSDDAHVFAPCSHDFTCPKGSIGVPCNFEAAYSPLSGPQDAKSLERYCYVVLRKKRRPVGRAWPRIASPVLCRGKHVVCRMCCSDGNLKEAVVTAAKHGKSMYKCAKASKWGDLIPAFDIGYGKEDSCQDDQTIMEQYLKTEDEK